MNATPTIDSPRPAAPGDADASRGEGRRVLLAIGGLLAVLSIAYGALNLLDLLAHQRSRTTQSFPATAVLDVDADGDVRVAIGEPGTIVVTTDIAHGIRTPSPSITTSGDRLVLRGSCPAFVQIWCHVSYTVTVPPGTRLVLRSDNGDIDATVPGGEVDATSSNGDVHLTFTAPPARVGAHSDNGDVTVLVPNDGTHYAVTGSTDNGDRHVDVPTDSTATATLSATSDNGDVAIRYAP